MASSSSIGSLEAVSQSYLFTRASFRTSDLPPAKWSRQNASSRFFAPLMEQPALAESYRVVSYHRVGCSGSSRASGPVSVAQEAPVRIVLTELDDHNVSHAMPTITASVDQAVSGQRIVIGPRSCAPAATCAATIANPLMAA